MTLRILWAIFAVLSGCACDGDDVTMGAQADAAILLTGGSAESMSDGGGDAAQAPSPAADLLVWDVETLLAQLERVQLLDVRSASAFEAGHLPTARSLDAGALRTTVDGVPGQVTSPGMTAAALSAAGVEAAKPVVVYGASSDLAAARVVWTLLHAGHEEVHMLDGGVAAWEASGQALATGAAAPLSTTFPDDRIVADLRVDTDWVVEHLEDGAVRFIDARSEAEFDAGHIPGAVNLPWQGNVADGTLLPLDDLQARHGGLSNRLTLVAYCQTGSRAAMAWLALAHLGYPDVRLYDGSMAAWTQNPERPLE